MFRIIDNKRIDLTDSEFQLYQEICKAYDRKHAKGSDLFKDLFETDENGIIIFLKPPNTVTSVEIFLFVISIFHQQHMRIMYDHMNEAISRMNENTNLVISEMQAVTAAAKQIITKTIE